MTREREKMDAKENANIIITPMKIWRDEDDDNSYDDNGKHLNYNLTIKCELERGWWW